MKGKALRINNKTIRVDIYIPEINLVIEYDGSFWHKEKYDKDKSKSNYLINAGFNLIRIRQKPLSKIFDNDISGAAEFDGKDTVNVLLKKISRDYIIGETTISAIRNYLTVDGLQNDIEMKTYAEKLYNTPKK
ncbi:MAG: DUF559 domain-containing protein [Crocinitomicaceae bacterium]|nr:DUF559 domain-containing protein [Crocinitomicaceae bacterium]